MVIVNVDVVTSVVVVAASATSVAAVFVLGSSPMLWILPWVAC